MSLPNFSFLACLEVAEKFGGVALFAGVQKSGIRSIQNTRQIVDGKPNDTENNGKKGGSKLLT